MEVTKKKPAARAERDLGPPETISSDDNNKILDKHY